MIWAIFLFQLMANVLSFSFFFSVWLIFVSLKLCFVENAKSIILGWCATIPCAIKIKFRFVIFLDSGGDLSLNMWKGLDAGVIDICKASVL